MVGDEEYSATNIIIATGSKPKMLPIPGIDNKIVRRVAVAAYELEINICIHSLGGSITFILDTEIHGGQDFESRDSIKRNADSEVVKEY